MKKNAFTIIEVLLAIFILTIAVFGGFSLIQQTVASASLSQSRLTAYYLAQEGIEIVRNTRDTNWLQGRNWLEGIANSAETVGAQSNFERRVIVREDNDGENNYLQVKVIVRWTERVREHEVEVITHLYNWY